MIAFLLIERIANFVWKRGLLILFFLSLFIIGITVAAFEHQACYKDVYGIHDFYGWDTDVINFHPFYDSVLTEKVTNLVYQCKTLDGWWIVLVVVIYTSLSYRKWCQRCQRVKGAVMVSQVQLTTFDTTLDNTTSAEQGNANEEKESELLLQNDAAKHLFWCVVVKTLQHYATKVMSEKELRSKEQEIANLERCNADLEDEIRFLNEYAFQPQQPFGDGFFCSDVNSAAYEINSATRSLFTDLDNRLKFHILEFSNDMIDFQNETGSMTLQRVAKPNVVTKKSQSF